MLQVGALSGHFVGAGFSSVENLGAEFRAGRAEEIGFLVVCNVCLAIERRAVGKF